MIRDTAFGRLLRRLAAGSVLPLHHARISGHWRSAWADAPLDPKGRMLAWYTLPAVELLERRRYAGKRVLEFGGGYSTAFWCQRDAAVTTLESDAAWFSKIGALVQPHTPRLYLVDEPLKRFPPELLSERFDVIVVDGLDRGRAAQLALKLLAPRGAVIVDNSEGSWSKINGDDFPILDALSPAAFQRVDFYGHGLGVFKPSCTSVFFCDRCFLFDQSDRPRTGYSLQTRAASSASSDLPKQP
jgi:hypothetical protein